MERQASPQPQDDDMNNTTTITLTHNELQVIKTLIEVAALGCDARDGDTDPITDVHLNVIAGPEISRAESSQRVAGYVRQARRALL
jgi:hypothetical protein